MARKVTKKKVLKKKVAKGGPPPSRHKAPPKEKLPGEGVTVGSIIMLVISFLLLGLIGALLMPAKMDGVDGYPFDAASAPSPPRNLLREADDMITKAHLVDLTETPGTKNELTFSELEINTYLNQRLIPNQRGLFGAITKVEGVYLDLKTNNADIYITRKIFGIPLTVKSNWDYYLSSGKIVRECKSSTVGRFTFKGAMFRPIMMPFFRFAKACKPENQRILESDKVRQVKLDEGSITLNIKA